MRSRCRKLVCVFHRIIGRKMFLFCLFFFLINVLTRRFVSRYVVICYTDVIITYVASCMIKASY